MLNSKSSSTFSETDLDVTVVRDWPALTEHWIAGVLEEFMHSASLSGMTAIAVMARSRNRDNTAHTLNSYLPTAPSYFPAVISKLAEYVELAPLIEAVRAYYQVQSTARGLVVLCCYGNERSDDTSDLAALDVVWQDVAAAGVRALLEFQNTSSGQRFNAAKSRLHRALELIACGQPASMADCWPRALPVTGERRLVMRTNVNAHIRIQRGEALLRLLVTNVSHKGIGVSGLTGVAAGELMSILWKPGVTINTRVSWVGRSEIGLEITNESNDWHDFVRHLLEATHS